MRYITKPAQWNPDRCSRHDQLSVPDQPAGSFTSALHLLDCVRSAVTPLCSHFSGLYACCRAGADATATLVSRKRLSRTGPDSCSESLPAQHGASSHLKSMRY
jgi:hypothetical protein